MPEQISFAKFRASVSEVGSGSTRPYLTAFNYTSAGSLYTGGLQNPSLLANPDLKPLSTRTYEIGADLRMFKGRLGFDVALYGRVTRGPALLAVVYTPG